MDIRLLTSAKDLEAYDAWVKAHPQGTLWQSLEWKKYQEAIGREVRVYGAMEDDQLVASALVVIDRTSFGFSTWDIQRGPLCGIENEKLKIENLMRTIINNAKKDKCLSIYLSPIINQFSIFNSQFSIRHEEPEATRIIDLTLSEEALLAQMHPKGRYNIKVAMKNGVHVERSDDIDAYYALAQKTAIRDHYKAASKNQYKAMLKEIPGSFLLLAMIDKTPIAGLIGIVHDGTGIYYYGASDHAHRALMAPYLLQWEAIKHCKAHSCTSYDVLGIAPPNADEDHPWKGISSFKEKFGGEVVLYPREQCITLKPMAQAVLKMKRRMFG